jgi:hypothetical protein
MFHKRKSLFWSLIECDRYWDTEVHTSSQMNGNCGEDVGPKGEIGLILRGEDERITNRLAVTSLLYRFKVSLVSALWSQWRDWSHPPWRGREDHQQAGCHLTPLQIQG